MSFLFFTFLVLNKSLTKGSKSLVYNVDRVVLDRVSYFVPLNSASCYDEMRSEIGQKKLTDVSYGIKLPLI